MAHLEDYDIAFRKIVFLFRKNVHEAVHCISSCCDNAATVDKIGFNQRDSFFGNSLAESKKLLTMRQALSAWTMLKKYRFQLLKYHDFDYERIISYGSPYQEVIPEFIKLIETNSLTKKNFPDIRLLRLYRSIVGRSISISMELVEVKMKKFKSVPRLEKVQEILRILNA